MQAQYYEEGSQLLRAVADQLKLPLMQIARQAELQKTSETELDSWQKIQVSADVAIAMVESYLLGLELAEQQTVLVLEPVSLASVLNDTAHQLAPMAGQYGVDIELTIDGKYAPVMAHPVALQTALASLGYMLLSLPREAGAKRPVITLSAYRNRQGVGAGLFGAYDLSALALRRARAIYGHSRQPLAQLGSGAAGIFVADTIFEAMAARLRVARYRKLTGFATTLQPSRQLQLV